VHTQEIRQREEGMRERESARERERENSRARAYSRTNAFTHVQTHICGHTFALFFPFPDVKK